MKIMNGYLDRLTTAARTDPMLARQFLLVAGFVERPETFFKPRVIWRVLTAGARRLPQPGVESASARVVQHDATLAS